MFYNLEDNLPVISARTESQLLAARDKIESTAASIAAGFFEAHPGQHCTFCAFRILCPAKEKRIPNLGPVTVDDPA